MNSLSEIEPTMADVWVNVGSSGYAKIRSRPSKVSPEIGEIDDGSVLRLSVRIFCDEDSKSPRRWLEVSRSEIESQIVSGYGRMDEDREYGYIALWIVSFEAPYNEESIVTGNARVRLREIPNGDLVKWLEPGTVVRAIAHVPDWVKVKVKIKTTTYVGWINSSYIDRLEAICDGE